ncbi:HAMP domain-containing histidine kinase [Paraburkholderia jirisanensis]
MNTSVRWRTSAARWLAIYATIFSLSFMALLGVIDYSVTRAMLRETDSGLRWQLRYFDSKTDAELVETIEARLGKTGIHRNYYGLFAANGAHLAGDIQRWPGPLELDHFGHSHEHTSGHSRTLQVANLAPELRVMGETRDDGTRLLVARTLSDVRHVRAELLRVLIGGGVIFLGTSLVAALMLSSRQRRRFTTMRDATVRIANGELAQRLPVTGRDELDMLSQLVNRMLDEIERLIGEVKGACDGIAHDLRTPLSRLRMTLANLARQIGDNGDDEMAAAVGTARDNTQAILNRFSALLRISEIGAMRRRSGFSHVMLPSLADELRELYEPLAEERHIRLAVTVASVEPTWADRELLFEAFTNLLDNAIKFAPSGGRVGIEVRRDPRGAQFVISDDGPGIPPHERGAVLGRFYRGEHASHVPGTGLGLGIVAAIARLHGFELRIGGASQGTTVVVNCWANEV